MSVRTLAYRLVHLCLLVKLDQTQGNCASSHTSPQEGTQDKCGDLNDTGFHSTASLPSCSQGPRPSSGCALTACYAACLAHVTVTVTTPCSGPFPWS